MPKERKEIEFELNQDYKQLKPSAAPFEIILETDSVQQKYSKRGLYYAFLSVITTVVGVVVWKWNPTLPKIELLTIRSAAGCLITYFLIKRSEDPGCLRNLFQLENMMTGICGATSIITYAISLLGLSVSEAATIYATIGIFNGIFGVFFLKEAYPNSEKVLGALSFFGVVLIVRPPFLFGHDSTDSNVATNSVSRYSAALLCLASTVLWSIMQILLRGAKRKSSALAVTFQNNFVMGIFCTAYLLSNGRFQPLGFEGYTSAILLAAFNVVLVYTIVKALEYEKASVVGLVGYTEIIFGILVDLIIFQIVPSPLTVTGIAIIIGSCLFLIRKAA